MAQDKEEKGAIAAANRVFEQPPDAMVCYADFAQIVSTGHEVILQFYESIPGPPSAPGGKVQTVRTRLRASVIVSLAHARNIGQNLLTQVSEKPVTSPPAHN